MKMKRAGLLAGSTLLALTPLGMPVSAWTAGAVIAAGLTSGVIVPAFADGGAGGRTGGGDGGTTSLGMGSPGIDGDTSLGGGGGGGSAGGGFGGTGGGGSAAGGSSPGADGADDASGGGGGGAGGSNGFDSLGVLTNNTETKGGNGGKGGQGLASGGGGGEGGYGAVVLSTGLNTNSDTIQGGNGGIGGASAADGGSGGDGGIGVYFFNSGASFTNSGNVTGGIGGDGGVGSGSGVGSADGSGGDGGIGVKGDGLTIVNESGASITGGNGGARGDGLTGAFGVYGAGGVGIEGSDLTITNGGTIAGGMQAIGNQQALAIHFTGGTNTLILEGNSKIEGKVQADGTDDTLILGGDDDGLFDLDDLSLGRYSGFEQFKKAGNSVWSFDGNSSSGPIDLTIEQGEVRLGQPSVGAVYGGNISVEPDTTLSGNGVVMKNLENDGVVAPGFGGDDYAALSVTGDYTQTPDATLRIIVTPGGTSRLFVSGAADLGGGKLDLAFAPGVYTKDEFTIVHSDGGLNGSTFDTVTENGGAVYGGIDYDANGQDVTLNVLDGTKGGSSSGGGGTVEIAPENGQVMGAAVNTVVMGAQVSTRALFGHLNDQRMGTTDDSLRTAFAGSNPNQVAFAGDLAELNAVLAELPQALAQDGGWFRATGGFGSIDGNNGAPGLDSYGGGFMAGYDRQVTDSLLLGAAVGFSRTQINQDDGSSASVNTPRVTLYGSYQVEHFALDLSLGYGYDRIKMRNQSAGGTAKSEHDAHELVAAMQLGYAIDLPARVVLTPRVGVDYLHLFEEGYKESGAGAFDLEAESSDTDSLKPHVGVSVAKTFTTDNGWNLTPELNLTYSREMLDDSHQAQVLVGGGNFTVEGVKLTRDELALGTELTAQMSQTFELFGGYTAILPIGNTVSHNFEAGLRASF